MRIRQVALVAEKLEPIVDALGRELSLEPCYRDPEISAFGLENALFRIDDTFLEVVSPIEPDTTAGRLLAKRDGDGGYMVIVQAADLAEHAAARRRVDDAHIRVVFELELDDVACVHLHPKDVGAAILSVDRAEPASSWRWAGPDWPAMPTPDALAGITAVEVQAADPRTVAARWGEVLGSAPVTGPGGAPTIELDGSTVRFVEATDGRGDGVGGIDIATNSQSERLIELCGTRIRMTR